jgi:hypothetical protein
VKLDGQGAFIVAREDVRNEDNLDAAAQDAASALTRAIAETASRGTRGSCCAPRSTRPSQPWST